MDRGKHPAVSTGVPLTQAPIPSWIRVRVTEGENFKELKQIVKGSRLHTVCEEARCPNIFDCWNRRTATFMILGDVCTRACRFCAVTSGRPTELDLGEPLRVAESVAELGLRHAVITSVDRDDLKDGGAGIFARTIRAIRRRSPGTTIEVLTPDFQGDLESVQTVVDARPGHLQPQHRNGSAPVRAHPAEGRLREQPRPAAPRQGIGASDGHEVRPDGRPR